MYCVYSLLCIVIWFLRQLPEALAVKVDGDGITRSITYLLDGERVHVPDWIGGPGEHYAHHAHEDVKAAEAGGWESCEAAIAEANGKGQDNFLNYRANHFIKFAKYEAEARSHIPIVQAADLLAKMKDDWTGDKFLVEYEASKKKAGRANIGGKSTIFFSLTCSYSFIQQWHRGMHGRELKVRKRARVLVIRENQVRINRVQDGDCLMYFAPGDGEAEGGSRGRKPKSKFTNPMENMGTY